MKAILVPRPLGSGARGRRETSYPVRGSLDGTPESLVDAVHSLEQAAGAHRPTAASQNVGKLVLPVRES